MQAVLAGEKLAPALLDFSKTSKQQKPDDEGADVAAAPALDDH